MKNCRILSFPLLSAMILLFSGCGYFLAQEPVSPKLSAIVRQDTIRIGNMDRSYTFYVPARPADKPALVFVLHGSTQNAEQIRKYTGYEFERLADTAGFIVVYPDGFKHNWNDCRKIANYPARTENIDDKGLVHALIERFHLNYGIDTRRVFATGYSNGGHMCFRLAFEMPDEITAVAAVSANLPTPDNSVCVASGKPVSVLIMNGTKDPLNPYEGGKVSLFGFIGNRGTVLSSMESARYFAALAGYDQTHTETLTLPHRLESDKTSVRMDKWHKKDGPEIVLYSVINGGHLIPQPVFKAPRMLGNSTSDINGPEEIWNFFNRQAPVKAIQIEANR